VPVSIATGNQIAPRIAPDGHGGVIVSLVNNGDGMTDLYAQRVFANGQLQPVQVFSPNGGEVIASGSSHQYIEWGAPSQTMIFKLFYSVDNGNTWKMIDQGIPGTTRTWEVPEQNGNKKRCKIKVIGYDSAGVRVGSDVSDGPFSIEVVRLTYPNGGESLSSGSNTTITWDTYATASPVTQVILSYSLDKGVTWKAFTSQPSSNTGSHQVTLPTVTKTKPNCKVKVVLKDSSGKKVGNDVSDGVFTISP
jgi:hypothetical protein